LKKISVLRLMAALAVISILLITVSCDNSEPVIYSIGDTGPSGVGLVFYVTDGGLHGMEVAPEDQSTGAAWSNITNVAVGTGTGMNTGSNNTDAIINQAGHTASAALICRNYRADLEGDWFLPSQDELKSVFADLVFDDGTNTGLGSFTVGTYWCSSETASNSAWGITSDGGMSGNSYLKSYSTGRVRAVRAF